MLPASPLPAQRSRRDLCPGVLRPWSADDGQLVRVRLVGGRITARSLAALGQVAATHGDGDVHLTGRANLQLRGLPARVPVAAFEAAGVLPSRSHELVRNLMVSPLSGTSGGRADLLAVARQLDALLLADPRLATLPGRFLFVLDDGRGDLVERTLDLGLVAVDASSAQVRVGSAGWGPVVDLDDAAAVLVALAGEFLDQRGDGPGAAWHVDEIREPSGGLAASGVRDERTRVSSGPLPFGEVEGGVHVPAPAGVLTPDLLADLVERVEHDRTLVVTPWRGVLVPS